MRAFIPRFTLAGFLLAIAGAAGLYGSLTGHMRPELLQTGSPLDVCVVGNGFLIASEPSTGQRRYAVRSARILLGINGQLVMYHGGQQLSLEPATYVPTDAISAAITHDGEVRYRHRESDIDCSAGQLEIALFASSELHHHLGGIQTDAPVLELLDQSPNYWLQSKGEQGHVQSGWLIRQPGWTEALFFVGRDVFLAGCGLLAIQSLWANWGLAKRQPTP